MAAAMLLPPYQQQFLALHHIDKAHRDANHPRGLQRPLLHQLAGANQCGGRVADSQNHGTGQLGRPFR